MIKIRCSIYSNQVSKHSILNKICSVLIFAIRLLYAKIWSRKMDLYWFEKKNMSTWKLISNWYRFYLKLNVFRYAISVLFQVPSSLFLAFWTIVEKSLGMTLNMYLPILKAYLGFCQKKLYYMFDSVLYTSYATFEVRKFESLFYKINIYLQKTTTCIGLQAEQISSVNI